MFQKLQLKKTEEKSNKLLSKKERKDLQRVIEDHISARIEELQVRDDPKEDRIAIENISRLMEIEKALNPGIDIDSSMVINAVTNLTGILLVLNYEQLKVISTKAFQMIRKLK